MAWAAIGGAAVSVVGGLLGHKKSKGGGVAAPSLMSSLMTAEQSRKMSQATDKAVGMADPFAQSRNLANTQLQQLMMTPGSVMNDPASRWAMDQGIEATNRGIAARHQTSSGNAGYELMQYGQGLANQQYNQRLQTLGNMASQGASPSTAANAMIQGTQLSQGLMSTGAAGGLASLSQPLGDLASGIGSRLFGGGNTGDNVDMTGFQNTNYNPWFQSQPTGGSLDYSTSYGTIPGYTGATSIADTGIMSGMY